MEREAGRLARERREHPRIVGFDVVSYEEFFPGQGGASIGIARTVDLSLGGVGIETAKPLPLGSVIQLRLAVRDTVLETVGRVVRLEERAPDKIRIGIRFTELSDEARDFLTGFIGGEDEAEVRITSLS